MKLRLELERGLIPSSYQTDCTHFVAQNLGIIIPKGEVPGRVLDDFVEPLEISENDRGIFVVRYNQRPHARHWGLAKDNKVVSKMGRGSVWEHDINDPDLDPIYTNPYGPVKFSLPNEYHPNVVVLFDRMDS